MSNQRKYNTYRLMFPEFVYESYHYECYEDGFHLSFLFRLGDKITFEPTALVPKRSFLNFDLPKKELDTLVFHIGMIELISYWKACCPPTVVVKCGSLTDEQIAFWKKLYYNGLGEFFYVNKITTTFDMFLNIRCEGEPVSDTSLCVPITNINHYLVPIGGGKDSVVTLEALQGAGCKVRPLIMNPRGATILCSKRAGFELDDVLIIKRTIHSQLLDLNSQGCLNGHTPFSAMLAFYTLLASAFSGISNIALSNESSANESTVVGTNVNHQYSKSLEFENDFRSYVDQFLGPQTGCSFNYFSFLRPLSELQIAMLFAREPKYFDVFKSCNSGSKSDIWCCNCAKCLFAYIILSPFIEPVRLEQIFGKNLFDDSSLKFFFNQLVGQEETKPFECVGTISEVNSALSMTINRWYDKETLPVLLKNYISRTPSTPLYSLFADHNLSTNELNILDRCINSKH